MTCSFNRIQRSLLDQGGFTLIEAMVAIVIFAIGILGAYQLQMYAVNGNTTANRVSAATKGAEYVVEELLAQDFDSLVVTSVHPRYPNPSSAWRTQMSRYDKTLTDY